MFRRKGPSWEQYHQLQDTQIKLLELLTAGEKKHKAMRMLIDSMLILGGIPRDKLEGVWTSAERDVQEAFDKLEAEIRTESD